VQDKRLDHQISQLQVMRSEEELCLWKNEN